MPIIHIVAAIARNGVIGQNGQIPWGRSLRDDLRHFANLTGGGTILAGRKTHEAIVEARGGPLLNRRTLILTRRADYPLPPAHRPSCEVVTSWEAAVARTKELGITELFVIGGSQVYALALPHADKMHLTRLDRYYDGDAFFPSFNERDWGMTPSELRPANDGNACSFRIWTYWRIAKPAPVTAAPA